MEWLLLIIFLVVVYFRGGKKGCAYWFILLIVASIVALIAISIGPYAILMFIAGFFIFKWIGDRFDE